MSPHDPKRPTEEEEQQLQALFDATIEPASQEQIHRLARSAAQIPQRSRAAGPVLVWLRRLVPAVGLAAAAAAAWFLLVGDGEGDGIDGTPPSPSVAMTAPSEPSGIPTPRPVHDGVDDVGEPLLDDGQEDLALAVLDGDVETDPEEDLGGDLDNPLAALDVGTAAMAGPLDGLDALFPATEDEESWEIYADALDALLEEDG